ncbi:MAG TPA: chromosomal replication initiator protein DnaA [Solirubrobacterales bacterium]|nr:chromosomal replication initiator protein DnaA [Solirubrobacterales bacterium]
MHGAAGAALSTSRGRAYDRPLARSRDGLAPRLRLRSALAPTTTKEDQVQGQAGDVRQDLAGPWREVQRELAASVPEDTFRIWFSPLSPVSQRGAILYVTGPQRVVRWVGRRYLGLLRSAVARSVEGIREVEFVAPNAAPAVSGAREEAASRVALNPDYTFDRFVIGPGNQLAHAAALAVAEAPGEAYNPLFLHGPPGLGKTHLLGSIANYLNRHSPQLTVHYTTAESFTNEFVSSLHGSAIDSFKERYRRSDVLLIDDVQFLQGKARTADEFFHTFNALYEGGAQLVITADRVPAELEDLADRLRDRFEWGLTVPLEPPDLATRLVFLGNLAREQSEPLPPDALRALASKTSPNLRVLKGALTRVVAISSLTSSAVTTASVEHALPSGTITPAPRALGARQVQEAVAARLGISVDELLSPNRTAPIARARQIAMYLIRELTDLSLPAIAKAFNRRDHTTVLHAIRRIERSALEDGSLSRTLEELTSELHRIGSEPVDSGPDGS